MSSIKSFRMKEPLGYFSISDMDFLRFLGRFQMSEIEGSLRKSSFTWVRSFQFLLPVIDFQFLTVQLILVGISVGRSAPCLTRRPKAVVSNA